MESLTITQYIAGQVEALLYDKLHQLLGVIATDYELSHGELVEKYLVYQNKVESPKFIYKSTGAEDTEVEEVVKPKKAPARKAKVTQKEAKAEEEPKEEARDGKCQAVTAKGLPCKNKGFAGGCFCRVHTKKDDEPKSDKKAPKKTRGKALAEEAEKPEPKKRGRKPKKAQPQHSHKLDEESEDCGLCETHGNPLKEAQEFEVSESDIKREALREIMKEELGVDEVTDEMLEEFENSMEADEPKEVKAKSIDEEVDEALAALSDSEDDREGSEAASEREDGEIGEEEFE
jgi:hypothetical protein